MRIETTYYADDGEEFYTEEECLKYEADCQKQFESVLFFDEKMEPLTTLEEIGGRAWYAVIKDGELAKTLFYWLCEQVGLDLPECDIGTGDILATDEVGNEWVNLTQRVAEYTQMMEAIGVAVKFYGQQEGQKD